MSTTPQRIPLPVAQILGTRLMQTWGLKEPEAMIVGSVRREKPDVGDLEIIAPLPAQGEEDRLYKVLRDTLAPVEAEAEPTTLFGAAKAAPKNYIGLAIKGLRPGFKCVDAAIRDVGDPSGSPAYVTDIKIQLSRYTAGPVSNFGWYAIRTTGSAEFGEAFLTLWKAVRGIGKEAKGSIDNFLVDETGAKRHTPTEFDAFRMVGLIWVPPPLRTGWEALLAPKGQPLYDRQSKRPEFRARAMRHLGIKDEADLTDRWNMDQLARVGGARVSTPVRHRRTGEGAGGD